MRTKIYITGLLLILLAAQHSSQAQRYYRNYHRSYSNYGRYGGYSSYPFSLRVGFIPRSYHVIPYCGRSYYYSGGYFYRPYGGSYSLIAPPLGIHISILPYGYRTIYYGGNPYYYSNGYFYYPRGNEYEVVNAPVGAEVPELPEGARVVIIDEQKYYEFNGTYYRESRHENGSMWYTVTGKHGVLNTENDGQDQNTITQPSPETAPQMQQAPANVPNHTFIGQVVDELPSGTRTVVINNQKLFVSPEGAYYNEFIENNQIHYKVVGK